MNVAAAPRPTVGAGAAATFILGGQIQGERPNILLVYPEGNYIRVSDTVPFLQIGEAKYGKFLLELAVRAQVDLQTAAKIVPPKRAIMATPPMVDLRRIRWWTEGFLGA